MAERIRLDFLYGGTEEINYGIVMGIGFGVIEMVSRVG